MTNRADMEALANAPRFCRTCGAGRREWMECEEPDCVIETQDEANARAHAATKGETDDR